MRPIEPSAQWVTGAKRAGHERDHSPISNAKVRNVWCYTSTLPHVFKAWCLINFPFTVKDVKESVGAYFKAVSQYC
jgi:hypothetical protein